MTPQEIRSKFEHGAPDCDRYKMQKIKVALAAAGSGSDAWGEKHSAAGGLDG